MSRFARYESAIRALPERQGAYDRTDLQTPELLMGEEGKLRMYYAPFDWCNSGARLVLLGLTPGWTQMEIAFRAVRLAMSSGMDFDEACRVAKYKAAFAGSLRTNLVRMLNAIGIPAALGLGDAADLFSDGRHLMHTTSAIRYPVFIGDRNYTGSPSPTRSPLLMSTVRSVLVPEVDNVNQAFIVPMGKAVEEILELLTAERVLPADRWLAGFPHPSGANGHRERTLRTNLDSLRRQVQTRFGM